MRYGSLRGVRCVGGATWGSAYYYPYEQRAQTAIHIYESHGFRRIQTDDFEGYSRGDYALEKVVRQ